MFTGIIEEVGTVTDVERRGDGVAVTVACRDVLADAFPGASIAVSGVCLTATRLQPETFTADLATTTLTVTSLGDVAPGRRVNLERPMPADGRFGGHLVQGHVDGVGTVTAVRDDAGTRSVRVRVPVELARYLVPKGSITVDGVSLTVVDVLHDAFDVALIPHTCAVTTLGDLEPEAQVNIEVDVVAKYVARLVAAGAESPYKGVRP